ncbi:MAG: NAD(P)/FAD-dependent oxidoreductase [Pseudomonadota bacterium]
MAISDASAAHSTPSHPGEPFDVVVVGAGFAGLYLLHRLRKMGLDVVVLEAGNDVGGTWYWNRYPGARCDVESLEYSYSFSEELQQEWKWTDRYAGQPEILAYIHHVADRFDLRRDIRLDTRVVDAEFDGDTNRWTIKTENGLTLSSRFCIMGTGCLSSAKVPDLPGLASFKGDWFHTGNWPRDGVDFTGKRVGVVGTGSTAIQAIPIIAKQAAELHVFQRTANYSIPLRNTPLSPEHEQRIKGQYQKVRQIARTCPSGVAGFNVADKAALETPADERERIFEERWNFGGVGFTRAFKDILFKEEANKLARDFVVSKMLAVVDDPEVATKLTPKYPIGTKRLCADTGYFQTYNRENVTLVDIEASPLVEATEKGLRTAEREYELDAIVFATGFDAITGALLAVNMRVKNGSDLKSKWAHGPRAYLGVMAAGLPNLFMVTGPGSPSVLSNVVVSIEQHVDWIADCLDYLRANGLNRIEAEQAAETAWGEHVDAVANLSLLPQAKSWYTGANIEGKPRVFMPYMGGVGVFREKCDAIAKAGYTGFTTAAVAE